MSHMTRIPIAARGFRRQGGMSLIELMIALLISALLALGIIQIFAATRTSADMQQGLSRVQENARFVLQYLERELRMVGFMGCGSDAGRDEQLSFVNHLSQFDGTVPGGNKFRFQRQMEAFTKGSMTAPSELATQPILGGTDVLILRIFSQESVPVLSSSQASNNLTLAIGNPGAAFLPTPGDTVLMGLQNCRSADVFAASLSGTSPGATISAAGATSPNAYLDPSVTSCGSAPCPWDFRLSNAFLTAQPLAGPTVLNAEVHRAEYYAFFIKNNDAGIPSLYMWRFKRDEPALTTSPEELVEGVENMQLRFGVDTSAGGDGTIDEYRTAEEVLAGATDEAVIDDNWRAVLSVRIGLLIRSAARAGVPNGSRTFRVIDTDVTPAATNDGAIREVYETTVALRNRLYNS